MAVSRPISTVYAQNLEERIRLEVLTNTLHLLFSEFGAVVDIVARKNMKARGQAFVVFERREDAETAILELRDFEVFGKPMKLSMARSRSDKTVLINCPASEFASHVKYRQAERVADKRRNMEALNDRRLLSKGGPSVVDSRSLRFHRQHGIKSSGAMTTTVVPDEYLPPNKILFLQNVPDQYDVESLASIFSRFEGFREIRLVPGRKGIAFVEYDAESGAIAAKDSFAGLAVEDRTIKVTYQRR